MPLEELQRIGLSSGEIRVYQALLDLGETTKTALAKQSGISPSNIYDVTNRLIEKGLVSKVEVNGVAHFAAAKPTRLLDYLQQKEEEIQEERGIVQQLLPALLAQYDEQQPSDSVDVFRGWQGLKTVFEDLLEECGKGDLCYVFGASQGAQEKKADRFFLNYSRQRAKKGIRTQIVFNSELKGTERVSFFLKSKQYDVRFLDQRTPAEIMVYHQITCIIILTQNPLVIRIKGEDVARSFLQYFRLMWGLALA